MKDTNSWIALGAAMIAAIGLLYAGQLLFGGANPIDSRGFGFVYVVLVLLVVALGMMFPRQARSWAIGLYLGVPIVIVLGGGGNLWPIAIALAMVYSLPLIAGPFAGAWLRRRITG